jgi:hypothetical protein
VLVAQAFDVTVTSTTDKVAEGVPVIVKLLLDVEDVVVVVKKLVVLPSGCALTAMVTPPAGIVELIVTVRGKSGPTAAASVVPLAGVVETLNVGSVLQGSLVVPPPPEPVPPFLLQEINSTIVNITNATPSFFIYNCFKFNIAKYTTYLISSKRIKVHKLAHSG